MDWLVWDWDQDSQVLDSEVVVSESCCSMIALVVEEEAVGVGLAVSDMGCCCFVVDQDV